MVLISDYYQLWGAVPAYFQNLEKPIMNKNRAFVFHLLFTSLLVESTSFQKAATTNSHSCVSISRFLVVDSPPHLIHAPFPAPAWFLYYLFTR